MVLRGMGQEITVLRPQTFDDFGRRNRALDVSHTIQDVLIEFDHTRTETERETIERTTGVFWLHLGSDLKAGDQVEFYDPVAGVDRTVRIDGRPAPVKFGFISGIRARFKEIGGETGV